MDKDKKKKFPNGFFSQPRPTVDSKETLSDVIPIKWSTDVINKKKKAVVYSTKVKKI